MILGSVIFVIISSILAFLAIVLALVSALLFARAKLTAVGNVKITINGETCFQPYQKIKYSFLPPAAVVELALNAVARLLKGEVQSLPPKPTTLPAKNSKTTGGLVAR
jgi:hypothetical protein